MGKPVSNHRVTLNLPFVRILLAAYGVSQREIAERAGVSKATVSKVLRNYRGVRAEKRIAVLRALAFRVGKRPHQLCLGRAAA
jgi:transcriptional regulator with XRE-family HTH domain